MAFGNSGPPQCGSLKQSCLQPLPPNLLIKIKSTVLPPPDTSPRGDMYVGKRLLRVQYLEEPFWSLWKQEYLLNITEGSVSPHR